MGSEVISIYQEDSEFSLACRMVPAMAFVSEPEVNTVFESLKELLLRRYVCLSPLLEYFEETYIGNQYRDARFEIALWNQYDRALEGLDRTNNSVEGWQRGTSATMGISNPIIWKFLESLKKRIKTQNSEIDQLVAGVLPAPRRRRWENLNERIEVAVRMFGGISNEEYLRGITFNLTF